MFTCDLQVWTQNLDQDLVTDLVTAVESSHSINTARVSDRAKWLMQKQLLSTALDEVTRSRQCGYPAGWLVQQLWAVLTQSFSLSPFTTFVALTQMARLLGSNFAQLALTSGLHCSNAWSDCLVPLPGPITYKCVASPTASTARLNRFESNEHARQSCQWARWLQVIASGQTKEVPIRDNWAESRTAWESISAFNRRKPDNDSVQQFLLF